MKPHETAGVTFENLDEIATAEQALDFVVDLSQFPEKTQAELALLASAVEDQHTALIAYTQLQSGAPECSLTISRIGTEYLIKRALEITVSLHSDGALRSAAGAMLTSYQAAQDNPSNTNEAPKEK